MDNGKNGNSPASQHMRGTRDELFPSEWFSGDEMPDGYSERLQVLGWEWRDNVFNPRLNTFQTKPVLLVEKRKPLIVNATLFDSLLKLARKESLADVVGYSFVFYKTIEPRTKTEVIRIDETQPALCAAAVPEAGWLLRREWFTKFASQYTRLDMSKEDVLDALGVETLKSYGGSFDDAIAALHAWRTAHSDSAVPPQNEPVETLDAEEIE